MADRQPSDVLPACVDSETLAAFVEGTLDPVARARVVAHLASCEDCSELVGGVVAVGEQLLAEPAPEPARERDIPKPLPFWTKRRFLAAGGGVLAVAASVMLAVLNRSTPLGPLVAAVGNERLTLARPTGDFHYGPLRSAMRGPRETASLALQAESAKLRERATRTGAARDFHASGVALLLAGDVTTAIDTLETAVRLQPNDAAFHADAGAAYMTRFVNSGNQADAGRALEELDKALSLSPSVKEAWFNKALLFQQLERPAEAVTTWNKYLELSDEPAWRDEATRNRDATQRQPASR